MRRLLGSRAWNYRFWPNEVRTSLRLTKTRKDSNTMDRYDNDIEGALDNIESQLGGGYLDLAEDWDKTEMDIT